MNPTFHFGEHMWIHYKHKFGSWFNWHQREKKHCYEDDPCAAPYDKTTTEIVHSKFGEWNVVEQSEWEYMGFEPNGLWMSPP